MTPSSSRSVPQATFPAVLARRQRTDPAQPLVTFYDDATGERVELSTTTYLNWVSKTAGLVQDELDVERGALVLVDLPTNWLGPVWLGAAWTMGLCVTDDATLAEEADLVVCGPAGVATYAEHADRVPVVALSLRPLGGRFTEPLPEGVTDYGAVVLAQPDAFTPYDPPSPADPAWRSGTVVRSQDGLLLSPAATGLGDHGRLLTDVNPCTADGLTTLVSAVLAGAGTVWVAHPDPESWSAKHDAERATAELRQSV